MTNNLVIVESPAKAKTIAQYLGPDYRVLASYGHIRDLNPKDGSVDPDHNFAMQWLITPDNQKHVNAITKAALKSPNVILATDPDREGEAIAWHIQETLQSLPKLKTSFRRITFNSITKNAVRSSLLNPRDVDQNLVDAYLARRALDYLVGFTISPVLWRKLRGAKSAGRVQSVALRLICDREDERDAFLPQEYWSVTAALSLHKQTFLAKLRKFNGKIISKLSINNEELARRAQNAVKNSTLSLLSLKETSLSVKPPPPFITSTLQQDASGKLRFSLKKTMNLAQKLYEGADARGSQGGLITYMRTDGVQIAPEAVSAVRNVVQQQLGKDFLPDKPFIYTSKARNAQEAHEAIRPTNPSLTPKEAQKILPHEQAALYELIWKRTLASQTKPADLLRITADFSNSPNSTNPDDPNEVVLRAVGQQTVHPGFRALYNDSRDEPSDETAQDNPAHNTLPHISKTDKPKVQSVAAAQSRTTPPPRYSEAALVRQLEKLGVGRPSTYASILSILRDRQYVQSDASRLLPDDRGRVLDAFLKDFFPEYVQYEFTAHLETQLDAVSRGETPWRSLLADFWRGLHQHVDRVRDVRPANVIDRLNDVLAPFVFPPNPDTPKLDPRSCPSCNDGRLSIKLGRFGAFIGCEKHPECSYTRPLNPNQVALDSDNRILGTHPKDNLPIHLKIGRFGPYLQLGDDNPDEPPKRASVPKTIDPNSISLNDAVRLLALPRTVGEHPETNLPVQANNGRFGPYVAHNGVFASIPKDESPLTIGLNRAVDLLAQKIIKQNANLIREIPHPNGKKPIRLLKGKLRPYLVYGRSRASLPASIDPDTLTSQQAADLVAPPSRAATTKTRAKKAAPKRAKKAPAAKAKKARTPKAKTSKSAAA